MLNIHHFVKPLVATRGPAVGFRAYSARAPAKDQVKDEITSKQINQQARRQSALGASDEEVGEADPSTGDKSRADETVESGGPFSKGERSADKQIRHGKDEQHVGRGHADAVRQENANKAVDIVKDSRQQGGYCQLSPLFSSALLLLRHTIGPSSVRAPSSVDVYSHAFSTSARVMDDDKLSAGEVDSPKMRDQRADGSSSPNPQPRSDDNPGKPSGVKPSYKRASGMPDNAADEAHPFGSHEHASGAATFRKQPQMDKSALHSVSDAITPDVVKVGGVGNEKGGGEAADECAALWEKGGDMFRDFKEGAEKMFGGGGGGKK